MTRAQNPDTYPRIYRVVRRIPRGRVATYGQVARLAGFPGHARLVGYALSALDDPSIPWQRVINAQGQVSERSFGGADEFQRELLEDEGIEFDIRGRVSFARYRWKRGVA